MTTKEAKDQEKANIPDSSKVIHSGDDAKCPRCGTLWTWHSPHIRQCMTCHRTRGERKDEDAKKTDQSTVEILYTRENSDECAF